MLKKQENNQITKNTKKVLPNKKQKEQDKMIRYHGITIRKNANCSTYYCRYRKDGKQNYLCAKTQKECLELLKAKLGVGPSKRQVKSFNDWYGEWFAMYKLKKVKASTIKDYGIMLNHLSDYFKTRNILLINPTDIMNELNNVKTVRTQQKLYEFLKAIFEKAKIHKKIRDNPVELIERPQYKRERGDILSEKEYNNFVEMCQSEKQYALLVILFEGLRIGEALAICGEDIDFENKTISINKSFNEKGEFDTTKNKQSIRQVPIFDNALNVLKQLDIKPGERVFNYTQQALRKNFGDIKTKCELKSTFRIHDLRHTFVTICQNERIPEHIIQHWVGHEIGSSVTKSVYTHISESANLLNINKLNDSKFYSNSTHILLTNKKS